MLYYTLSGRCVQCNHPFQCSLIAEVEPPADTIIRIICPLAGEPVPVSIRAFKPCAPFPPTRHVLHYPPRPPFRRGWWKFR